MTETKVSDLIGLTEIADLYGVSKDTANGWRRAKDFPKPVHQLAMGPMWDRNEVLAARSPGNRKMTTTVMVCQRCLSTEWQGAGVEGIGKEEYRLEFLCGGCGYSSAVTFTRKPDRQYHMTFWAIEEDK